MLKLTLHITCLGITFSSNLSWKKHVDQISRRLSFAIAILYRLSKNIPKSCLRTVYMALFTPHINYCSLVWGSAGASLIHHLQTKQNRAIRIMLGLDNFHHVSRHHFSSLGILNIPAQLQLNSLVFAFSTINEYRTNFLAMEFATTSSLHDHHTRQSNHHVLSIDFARTSYRQRFVKYDSLIFWNRLPRCLRNLSLPLFKKSVYSHLLAAIND